MRIACLGWGSLIWCPRDLPVQGIWQHDGPQLPIEFARQSQDDRITLVCMPGYDHRVQSLWALLSSPDIGAASEALCEREGTKIERIGVWARRQAVTDDLTATIETWANPLDLDAVVWTNLPPKFQGVDGRIPSADEVIAHLSHLGDEKRTKAEEYIRKAPRQISTPYRALIGQALGWLPVDGS